MNVLFPSSPLAPREVDPDFADQAEAAQDAGFGTFLVSFEDLQQGVPDRATRNVPPDSGPSLYRGWMLKPHEYRAFSAALERRGSPLTVDPQAYAYAHQLPGWYTDFQHVTPYSVWTQGPDLAEVRKALGRMPAGPAVVKDFVKSAKHRWLEACFIPEVRDEDHAMNVITRFLDEQGADLNGGVVLRTFRPYPHHGFDARTGAPEIDERRVFLWKKTPLKVEVWEEGLLRDSAISEAIARLRSPFVSLDLARLPDDRWEVVEVGDGQVSGLRSMNASCFYRALKASEGRDS